MGEMEKCEIRFFAEILEDEEMETAEDEAGWSRADTN